MQVYQHDGVLVLTAMLVSSLFTGFSGLFTTIFQAVGREKEATAMSLLRGLVLIPVMIAGNAFWGFDGLVWSLTVSEGLTLLVALALWLRLQHSSGLPAKKPAQPENA